MRIKGIRGAITVRENCEKEIIAKTKELLSAIMEANDLTIDRIISITFTATRIWMPYIPPLQPGNSE